MDVLNESGVFPAHAGMIPIDTERWKWSRSVPRTRGDDPDKVAGEIVASLCSPHTRG